MNFSTKLVLSFFINILIDYSLLSFPIFNVKKQLKNFFYAALIYESVKFAHGFWELKKEQGFDFFWNKTKLYLLKRQYLNHCGGATSLENVINDLLEIYVGTTSVEKQVLVKSKLEFLSKYIKRKNKISELKKNKLFVFKKQNKFLKKVLSGQQVFYVNDTPFLKLSDAKLLEKIIREIPLLAVTIDCSKITVRDLEQGQSNENIFATKGFFEKLYVSTMPNKHFLIFKNFDRVENRIVQDILFSFFKNKKKFFNEILQKNISFKNTLILVLIDEEKSWFDDFVWSEQNIFEQIAKGTIEKLLKFPISKFCTNQENIQFFQTKVNEIESFLLNKNSNNNFVDEQLLYLKKLLTIFVAPNKGLSSSVTEIKTIFNQHILGLEQVKEELCNYAALSLKSLKYGRVLCLVGPPGVGKTYFAETTAKALSMPFYKISAPSLVHQGQLKGMPRSYQHAEPGVFSSAILQAKQKNVLIVFDEFDKMVLRHPELMNSLLDVFDPLQRHKVFDNYLGTSLDLSSFFFILTTNDVNCFPDYLEDRCFFVFLRDYNTQEKTEILHNFFIPKFLEQFNLEKNSLIFTEKSCFFLVNKYSALSLRGLQKKIESLVGKIFSSDLLSQGSLVVTEVLVEKFL